MAFLQTCIKRNILDFAVLLWLISPTHYLMLGMNDLGSGHKLLTLIINPACLKLVPADLTLNILALLSTNCSLVSKKEAKTKSYLPLPFQISESGCLQSFSVYKSFQLSLHGPSFVLKEYEFGSWNSTKETSTWMMNHTRQLCISQLNEKAALR